MELVKELRLATGVKQREIASYLGMDQSNYCNMENGKLIPNNISEIKCRAIDYLLPKLTNRIHLEEVKLKALYVIRDKALTQ